jgi:hypothetical protein
MPLAFLLHTIVTLPKVAQELLHTLRKVALAQIRCRVVVHVIDGMGPL